MHFKTGGTGETAYICADKTGAVAKGVPDGGYNDPGSYKRMMDGSYKG